ncbi:unnamed protein product [Protopolystoma xenopodis]|uniref:Uncharacterized protein n=1 Tax=Protopolystoma xenopodis TaxID=117903 RepID=A0A448WJB6_9PLAT|nr:unnamed protein product [Protopolystoma xenopodis]
MPEIQSFKIELDSLKRELGRRDDRITSMERECQERHIRRIEVLQVHLRRFEEEAANMNAVLDEQRKGIEERERTLKQLRTDQSSIVELEKLRKEHSQCSQQLEQRAKHIATLANQLENQTEEILTIKLEFT